MRLHIIALRSWNAVLLLWLSAIGAISNGAEKRHLGNPVQQQGLIAGEVFGQRLWQVWQCDTCGEGFDAGANEWKSCSRKK